MLSYSKYFPGFLQTDLASPKITNSDNIRGASIRCIIYIETFCAKSRNLMSLDSYINSLANKSSKSSI